jgi:serine kinase of HPr protein (carbohydrate metabolism regulator)
MLNRLGWAEGIAFESYGLRLGVRISEFGFTERVEQALPHGARLTQECEVDHLFSLLIGRRESSRTEAEPTCVVYSDAVPVARVEGLDSAIDSLKSSLRLLVGEFARDRVFVHAGVVGWNGRAILIPGRSFTGKSRLTAAFVRAGARFYSDEYAVLSADGLVHPFAQPISIRDEASFRGHPLTAEELGEGGIGTEPLIPGLVLVSRYKQGAVWRARRLSPGRAMLDLLSNTLPARRRPAAALAALEQVVVAAPSYRVTRGEADEAVPRALRLLERAASAHR